jgi:hypothetical protein
MRCGVEESKRAGGTGHGHLFSSSVYFGISALSMDRIHALEAQLGKAWTRLSFGRILAFPASTLVF